MNKNLLKVAFISVCLFYLQPTFSKEIKIGLITTNGQILIGSNGKAKLINLFNDQIIRKTSSNELFTLENIKGLIKITDKSNNTSLGAFRGPVKLITEEKSYVICNKNPYRGSLIIFTNNEDKNITVANELDMEEYLFSVVPSEIPYKWHKESLKAQSVAARSYAYGYLGRRKKRGYDLESSVEDQVYLGVKSEKTATSDAVKETSGLILVDKDNNPLIALYHSSGGGYTDSIENLWEKEDIKPSVHIQPRPDYDDNSPHFNWSRTYTISEINSLLMSLNVGNIKNITPLSRSISNRVTKVKIIGTNGDKIIRGEELRLLIKLPSSKFNLKFKDDFVFFAGRGYGHGLGLSQWGSKELAENGFTYKEILTHYYPLAMLVKHIE